MHVCMFCAFGMSTSILVSRINTAAKNRNIDLIINAYSINDLNMVAESCELIVLSPQIKNAFKMVKKKFENIPTIVLSVKEFGLLNEEERILEHFLEYKQSK